VMIWELSNDTPDAELLTTAHRALLNPLGPSAFEMKPPEPARPVTVAGGR